VAGGVVYIGNGSALLAFSAAGTTGCSGTPTTCTPLWSGVAGGTISSSAAVANGVVYLGSSDTKLYAFSAAGTTNCSGTPRTCNPLWTAATGNEVNADPAVAKGVVYVGSSDAKLYAFSAAGTTNCSGTPKTCNPLFSAAVGNPIVGGAQSPAVANGWVYVGGADNQVHAFS
jgi:outer membrane protein assembly factor BamB